MGESPTPVNFGIMNELVVTDFLETIYIDKFIK